MSKPISSLYTTRVCGTTVCSGGSTDFTTILLPVSTGSYNGSGSEGNGQQGDSTTLIGAVY